MTGSTRSTTDLLRLGLLATSSMEHEQRLPIHPHHLDRIDEDVRAAMIVEHGYGADFSLEPGHPNQIAGGKRPYHTIIPSFVTREGEAVGPFGVMGGHMQPQGHMQMIINQVDYGMNPQTSLDAPRWRYNEGLEINVEQQMDPATVAALQQRGHKVDVIEDNYQDFGAGQFIWRLSDDADHGYVAASDSRRDGHAVGF